MVGSVDVVLDAVRLSALPREGLAGTYPRREQVAAWSLVAAAVRLGPGLTASPLPSAAAQLRTTGVYGCVRHPIYTGLLVDGAGVVLLGGRLTRVWEWLGLLALWGKTWLEERKLTARFSGYRD